MEQMPFRVLTDAEFQGLNARDRAAYVKRAIEAIERLEKQVRHTLRDDQKKNANKAAA